VIDDKTCRFELGVLVPVFPLLSSVNHLASAVGRGWYARILEKKVNWLRWAEYSLSAGVMTFIISILSGVTEVRTLTSLMIMNVTLQVLGMMIEVRKAEGAPRSDIVALLCVAWGVFSSMWVQIIVSFYTVVSDGSKPPTAVYSIIWTMFSLFASFGVAQTLYCFDVMSFASYEVTLASLSLTSKSLLSWLVYGGILVNNRQVVSSRDASGG